MPFFLVWGIDRVTKIWALGLMGIKFVGPFGFVLFHNHGAMLGLFSDMSPVIRVVSLSTGGAFLLFMFVIIQYLLPIKSVTLRAGLSILLGGILGNVADRIIYGNVIDFLLIGTRENSTPAFNIADAVQWVGYAMIATALVREGDILWPANELRKKMWINLRFQLRYCFILVSVGLGFSAIAGVYSYTFLRVAIIDLTGMNYKILNSYLMPFLISFSIVSVAFAVILFLIGRILSARIAGPLYAFEKFLDDLVAGKPRNLRLRNGDEFKHLEQIAARLVKQMADHKMVSMPSPDQVVSEIQEPSAEIPVNAGLSSDLPKKAGV